MSSFVSEMNPSMKMHFHIPRTVFALVIVGASTRILRLGCLQYANFSSVVQGKALIGSIIATFLNISPEECEQECIDNRDCKSINAENAGSKTCQLNRKSISDASDGVSLTGMPGWTFKSTSYSERKVRFQMNIFLNFSKIISFS